MNKFQTLTAIAAPFPKKNVDTDLIIRIERCTGMPKEELGKYAFEMARYLPDGAEDPSFVFNQPRYRKPKGRPGKYALQIARYPPDGAEDPSFLFNPPP